MRNAERGFRETSNVERRTLNTERNSPCSLRLLTPTLSSFGEEKETESRVLFWLRRFARIIGGVDL